MAKHWMKVSLKSRKRKGGKTWIARYWQNGESKYGRSFHDKGTAEDYRADLEKFLNGKGPDPDLALPPATDPEDLGTRTQWSEAVDRWLATGARRAKTQIGYRSALTVFAKRAKVQHVEQVTPELVQEFLDGLKRDEYPDTTIAAHVRTLSAFFAWASYAKRGEKPRIVEFSPIDQEIREQWKPYKKRGRARPHRFTDEEYDALIAACDIYGQPKVASKGRGAGKDGRGLRPCDRDGLWWKAFITVLYDCGLRLNEATHLIWQDIDFAAGLIRIQPHVNLPDVLDWRPKGKAHRTVPMTPRVVNYLAAIQHRQRVAIPYAFLTEQRFARIKVKPPAPGRELIEETSKRFVRIRKLAGIAEGILHDLRGSAITRWLKTPGLTPKHVQLLAGHEDIQTTLGFYARVEEADAVAVAQQAIAAASQQPPTNCVPTT
ncbi:MAG: hypothetical protein AMXMBFR13_34660 [Phycisphaerae bacterium]